MSQSDLHKAALELAAKGIPVFPCCAGGKSPATTNGFHDASTDPRQIDAWWSEDPSFNVAFCPETVGLCGVDLDGGQVGEDSWSDLQIEHGFAPDTREIHTPSGGRHLYFKGSLGPSTSKLANKVDTRGRGSYFLVPPSVVDERGEANPEKWGSYTYINDIEPAPVPTWIAPLVDAKKTKAVASADIVLDLPANISRAISYLKNAPPAIEGQGGDNRTYIVACDLLNLGVSQDVALDLLEEHWNPRCEPPWDMDDLVVKLERAEAYAQNDAGAWAVAPAQEVFGEALGKLVFEAEPARRSRFHLWTLDELRALPPPSWLIPDMIPAESLSLIYGPTGTYKSFIALGLSMGLAVDGKDVVYVGAEGGRGLEIRASAWKMVNGVSEDPPLRIVRDMPWANDGQMVEEFLETVKASGMKPALVVIDTAARAMVGLNENDAKDVGLFVAAMDTIRVALGCSVLIIHHTGKDEGRGSRGSAALPAAMDAVFELKTDHETKATALYCRKQKDAAERDEPWCYEGKDILNTLVFQPIAFHEYLRMTKGEDGLGTKQVGAALSEMGARGEDNGVTTHVLATHLAQAQDPDLSGDQLSLLASRLIKALTVRAKGPLEAYGIVGADGLHWYLPG